MYFLCNGYLFVNVFLDFLFLFQMGTYWASPNFSCVDAANSRFLTLQPQPHSNQTHLSATSRLGVASRGRSMQSLFAAIPIRQPKNSLIGTALKFLLKC